MELFRQFSLVETSFATWMIGWTAFSQSYTIVNFPATVLEENLLFKSIEFSVLSLRAETEKAKKRMLSFNQQWISPFMNSIPLTWINSVPV